MPLQIGNEWHLRVTQYDSLNNVTRVSHDTISIAKDTLIGTDRWFMWAESGGLNINRSDGYWVKYGDSSKLFAKYPALRNETYVWGDDTVTYLIVRIISTDSVISVPAGSFSCFVYEWRWNYGLLWSRHYFAVDKGQIRYDVYQRAPSGRDYVAYRFEVESFRLN